MMNGNNSIANVLLQRKDQSRSMPQPVPLGTGTSFRTSLDRSMAVYDSGRSSVPAQSGPDLAARKPDDISQGRADTVRERERPQERQNSNDQRQQDTKSVERDERKRSERKRDDSPANRKDNEISDRKEKTSDRIDDDRSDQTSATEEEGLVAQKNDSRDDAKKLKAALSKQSKKSALVDEPTKIELNQIAEDGKTDFFQDLLSMSLMAGKGNVRELSDKAAHVQDKSNSTSNKDQKEQGPSNKQTQKIEPEQIRTIESMMANLMRDIGDATAGKAKTKSNKKSDSQEPVREGKQNKKSANEPVVKVHLDENKWSVNGDVSRETEKTNHEFTVRTDSSKYSKSAKARHDVPREGQLKEPAVVDGKDTGSTDGRGPLQSADVRKAASFEMSRAARDHKAHVAENRKAFNELVEKARLSLGPDGRSSASIRLNPPHLGRMTMNLQLNNNHLQAKILVENQEARRMLMDDMEFLQKELRIAGIQVESFSVRVRETQSAFEATNQDAKNQSQTDSTPADGEGTGAEDKDENGSGDSGNDNDIVGEDAWESAPAERKNESLVNISV